VDRTDHVEKVDRVEIVVKGRHTEVTDRFREHVKDKLGRLERLDPKAYRIDVEVCHESNPRLAAFCDRVELTLRSRGPAVRAEAAAQDPYGALDIAVAKLEERLRRAADRRRARHQGHYGHPAQARSGIPATEQATEQIPVGGSTASTTAAGPGSNGVRPLDELADVPDNAAELVEADVLMAAGPLVVREKAHDATPISLDDALHRMELVGHDFYLYCDVDCGLPSVVYRRRGYTYGVLRLNTGEPASG
jgi:ribosomal subunit interface protein